MALTNWLECNYLSFREKDSEFGGNVKKEVVFKGIRSFRTGLVVSNPNAAGSYLSLSRLVPKIKSVCIQSADRFEPKLPTDLYIYSKYLTHERVNRC